MRKFLLTIVFGIFYVASTSCEYVSFVNDARTFTCHGKNVRWVSPIGAQVPENSTKYEIVAYGDQGSQLTVKNINPIDIGYYRCIAENKTEKFELKVYYPLTVEAYPSAVAVRQNQDLSLKCRTNGVPQASIKWYHGKDELVQSSVIRMNGNELTIKQIQPEHAGTYTCLAIQKLDSFKNVQEREINVVVEHPPTDGDEIDGPIVSYHNIGSTITLQCHAKAIPNSQFKWVRNGYEIFDGVTNFNDDSRLTITIDSVNALGTYSCEASNKHGDLHQIFKLKNKADEPPQMNRSGSNLNKISVSLVFFAFTSIFINLFV